MLKPIRSDINALRTNLLLIHDNIKIGHPYTSSRILYSHSNHSRIQQNFDNDLLFHVLPSLLEYEENPIPLDLLNSAQQLIHNLINYPILSSLYLVEDLFSNILLILFYLLILLS